MRKKRIVMATGVFDILHPGHLAYLEEAKKLGDELVVVVARDSTVRKRKGEPVVPEEQRLRMVQSLKVVDKAVLGKEGDIFEIVREIRPDVIALGPNQEHDEEEIRRRLEEIGMGYIEVVRIKRFEDRYPLNSTRKIIERVLELYGGGG